MEKIKYPEPVDPLLYQKYGKDLHAMYGLPTEVEFCKKCVISNQRPNSAVEYQHTKGSKKPQSILVNTVSVMLVVLLKKRMIQLIGLSVRYS